MVLVEQDFLMVVVTKVNINMVCGMEMVYDISQTVRFSQLLYSLIMLFLPFKEQIPKQMIYTNLFFFYFFFFKFFLFLFFVFYVYYKKVMCTKEVLNKA